MHLTRSTDRCTFVVDADSHGRPQRLDQIQAQVVASDLAIRVDLGRITAITSPELAQLVELHKELSRRGKELIVDGCQPMVRKVLTVTRLDQVLSVV